MATENISIADLRRLGFASSPSMGSGEEITPSSSFGNPITNSFFGINYMQTPLPVPINKDHFGLVFFTRPLLNFQSSNLKNVRKYYPLLTTEEMNVLRAVRCYLDPRLQAFSLPEVDVTGAAMSLKCPLVDPLNPFISLLTNHIDSLSGMPDVLLPTYNSPEGQYREVHSMVDGTAVNYSAYNITATFRNSRGDPITKLFDYWSHYIGHVFEGLLAPYGDMMLGNLLDYNTRIYRLILDPSKSTVVSIGACGAAFPINVPRGSQFDFNNEKPYNDANAKVQIQFQANGAMYDDEILIWSFNKVVECFNPSMHRSKREGMMKPIPRELMEVFNCRAYPYIDPTTRKLLWYVTNEYYEQITAESETVRDALDSMMQNSLDDARLIV